VGQDCILLAGFQPAFLRLSSGPHSCTLKKLPYKLSLQRLEFTSQQEQQRAPDPWHQSRHQEYRPLGNPIH
jgi:hypothetical protein